MQPFPSLGPTPRNQFVNDFSDGDFSDQMGYVAGSGNLTIQFFYDRIRLEDPTNPEAHGQYKTVLCVKKRPHGDRHTESVRMISERMAQQLYPREFAYFKQSVDVPTDGTPLHELPGISQSQIAILVIHGIRSVEDLVGLHADQVGQIGMDARTAYALAKKWIDSKKAGGELIADAAKDAARDAELERLRNLEREQSNAIAKLQAQVELLTGSLGAASQKAQSVKGEAQFVDADDLPETPETELFSGAQVVTGNDDLDDEPEKPAPSLPGMDRKKR